MKRLVCRYTGYPEFPDEYDEEAHLLFYPLASWFIDAPHTAFELRYTLMTSDLLICLGRDNETVSL